MEKIDSERVSLDRLCYALVAEEAAHERHVCDPEALALAAELFASPLVVARVPWYSELVRVRGGWCTACLASCLLSHVLEPTDERMPIMRRNPTYRARNSGR